MSTNCTENGGECKLNTKRQLQMHIDCQAMNWVLRKQNSFRIVPTHFSIQCITCDLLLDTNKAQVFLLPPGIAYLLKFFNFNIDTTAYRNAATSFSHVKNP